jgi:hypothetical protein|tara:strand:- start:179 stop:481 length:303 start_codon:yes stop_codon:yes gene_type:complete
VSALADVQRALNAIRSITSEEQAAVRLEVLRLMATVIADEARDIEGVKVKTAQPKRAKQLPTLPISKSANSPKPTQVASTPQVSQQDFEPIQAIKPIAPK